MSSSSDSADPSARGLRRRDRAAREPDRSRSAGRKAVNHSPRSETATAKAGPDDLNVVPGLTGRTSDELAAAVAGKKSVIFRDWASRRLSGRGTRSQFLAPPRTPARLATWMADQGGPSIVKSMSIGGHLRRTVRQHRHLADLTVALARTATLTMAASATTATAREPRVGLRMPGERRQHGGGEHGGPTRRLRPPQRPRQRLTSGDLTR